jgi:DNA-binding transcriptional ArsR family regulator
MRRHSDSLPLSADALKAFAHPVRIRLYQLLEDAGPATATQLGTKIDESSSSTSYHLRQLAKHGMIVNVPGRSAGRGKGRERWWRTAPGGFSLKGDWLRRDPDTAKAAEFVLARLMQQRNTEISQWLAESQSTPHAWVEASENVRTDLRLTREDLTELVRGVQDVLNLYRERSGRRKDAEAAGRPDPEAVRVIVHFDAFPVGLSGTHPDR